MWLSSNTQCMNKHKGAADTLCVPLPCVHHLKLGWAGPCITRGKFDATTVDALIQNGHDSKCIKMGTAQLLKTINDLHAAPRPRIKSKDGHHTTAKMPT